MNLLFPLITILTCSLQPTFSFDPKSHVDPNWTPPSVDLDALVDAALNSHADLKQLYTHYRQVHEVHHGNHETEKRLALFRSYLVRLKQLEKDQSISWTPRITMFGHMTKCEKKLYFIKNGSNPMENAEWNNNAFRTRRSDNMVLQFGEPPASYDYRELNAVTSVKQQLADDCWAYASVTAVEAQIKTLRGSLHELSTQELVDCVYGTKKRERSSTGGGWPQIAYQHLLETGRLGYRRDIPEKASPGFCAYSHERNALEENNVIVDAVQYIDKAEAIHVIRAVALISPVSVVIEVENAHLDVYGHGDFDPRRSKCGPGDTHAVAIVGYDKKYYYIKNSWGPNWGNQGYFWWVRAPGGTDCGIYERPSYPIMEISFFKEKERLK